MAIEWKNIQAGDWKEEVYLLFQGTVNPEFEKNINV